MVDPQTGSGAYMISGGTHGGTISPPPELQSVLTWLSLWAGVLEHDLFSTIVDTVNTMITIIDALLHCPTFIAQFVAYFAISVLVCSVLLVVVFTIIELPLVGVLIAAGFSYILDTWLKSFQNYQCV